MNPLKKLYNELENRIGESQDEFPSRDLRHLILNGVLRIHLGNKPRDNYFRKCSDTEMIRLDYFTDASNIGSAIAKEYLEGKIVLPPDHFLRKILRMGIQSIGQDIAREYAFRIYPELRQLKLEGKDVPVLPAENTMRKRNFCFTVETDRNIYELSQISRTDLPVGSNVFYDDICERHIETFVFDSIEAADVAHWNWDQFIHHETARPPVKYAVRLESDANEISVSTVFHVDLFEKTHSESSSDGSTVEWEICDTLGKAEEFRQEKLKERQHSEQNPAVSETPIAEIQINRHSKVPEFSPREQRRSNRKNLSFSK